MAAPLLRSMMRPSTKGPLSFTLNVSDLPVERLVTCTRLFNGNVLCAAVMPFMSKGSPSAVGLPWNLGPYHEAMPVSS